MHYHIEKPFASHNPNLTPTTDYDLLMYYQTIAKEQKEKVWLILSMWFKGIIKVLQFANKIKRQHNMLEAFVAEQFQNQLTFIPELPYLLNL